MLTHLWHNHYIIIDMKVYIIICLMLVFLFDTVGLLMLTSLSTLLMMTSRLLLSSLSCLISSIMERSSSYRLELMMANVLLEFDFDEIFDYEIHC